MKEVLFGDSVFERQKRSARAVRAGARVLCRLYKDNVVTIKDNRGRGSTKCGNSEGSHVPM